MPRSQRVTDDEIRLSTRPSGGTDGTTRRFNRNLAILAREMVPPELLIEYHLAVLQNQNPVLARDGRAAGGWLVRGDEKARELPTLADKAASIKFLREAGWGMPAQAHYVDMDVSRHAADSGVDLASISGDPQKLHQIAQALRLALAGGAGGSQSAAPLPVLDALSSEVPDQGASALVDRAPAE